VWNPLNLARESEGALWVRPAVSGAKSQPKLNLMHFSGDIR